MPRRRRPLLAAAAGVAALSSSLFLSGDDASSLVEVDGALRDRRSLRATTPGGNQAAAKTANRTTVAVYLARTPSHNPGYSVFHTDLLQRYGSGRINFRIERYAAACDPSACAADRPPFLSNGEKDGSSDEGPCLAVANWMYCRDEVLRCNYPRCQTMVTNDEKCQITSADVRGYYTSALPDKAYLPLGPRLDAWTSLQKLQSRPGWRRKPASERRHAFNAIFSQSTHPTRQGLAGHIQTQDERNRRLNVFATMAKTWTSRVNSKYSEQLNTDRYTEVMLDSVFTLAPAGHNPECYRLFEIVDAGSIPVMVKSDLYGGSKGPRRTGCKDSLAHWRDAPMLVLDKWTELYPAVERLMEDKAALDEMQENMRKWYDQHMRTAVSRFEDYMLDPDGAVNRWREEREEAEAEAAHLEAWKKDKEAAERRRLHREYREWAWERRFGRPHP